jgi:hypothetical protein
MNRTVRTRKSFMIVVAVCAVLAVSLVLELQMNRVTEAAVIEPHPGLVGWWRFDEGTGSIAKDSSGFGNDGAIYGTPTWVTGKYGQALSFNGVNSYVSTSLLPQTVGTPITIAGWIYCPSLPSAHQFEFGFRDNSVADFYVLQTQGSNVFEMRFRNSAGTYFSLYPSFTPNTWVHVALTYDGSTLKGYINGVSIGSVSASGTFGSSTNNFRIGEQTAGVNPSSATIDEVRIYNRALSAAEIQADFKEGPDFSVNLLTKVPKGTTQVITTLSWQGVGSINVTIVSPSQNYTESMLPEYQKTVYSTSSGTTSMLNIKRLSVSVSALSSDQNWYVVLTFNSVDAYQITVEVQK